MQHKKSLAHSTLAVALFLASALAEAQIMGELDVRREGPNAVIQVNFEVPVQLRRSIASASGDLVQVVYDQVTPSDTLADQRDTTTRRVRIAPGQPEIQVIDMANVNERNRRLVVRMEKPIKVKVRAGLGNQSIEIVLPGMGPAVKTAPPPAAAPAAQQGGAAAEPAVAVSSEAETRARQLFAAAKASYEQKNYQAAIEQLNELLNLPPTSASKDAQELIGMARLRAGDVARARAEFSAYLNLYPTGPGAERVKRELDQLPQAAQKPAEEPKKPAVERSITGSTSLYYYGGNGQTRSQDFKDSPIAGLPSIPGEATLSSDKFKQLYTDIDLNWRHRDAERDMRLVFRDSYTGDLQYSDKSKNRLSAAYFDYKSLVNGTTARIGRQSPTGGGVMGRFDGAQVGYAFYPKWKLGAVAGKPSEPLFNTSRHFYGMSLDSEALLKNFGATVYGIQQMIDGEIDRRAVGLELRYFKGGASVFSQFDYDTLIKGLNIAMVQGTLIMEDNTVYNVLYDRRALTMLALGNSLTFEDPNNPGFATSIQGKLNNIPIDVLRQQVRDTTPYVTQALLGLTKPINPKWQVGANLQLTNTGSIPPVPGVSGFEQGRPATGNIYTLGGQVIGLNLYSPRDTHVFAVTLISSPSLKGYILSYNNSSMVDGKWQIEPSLQYYADRNPQGGHSERWTPGLRATYRNWDHWALEAQFSYEIGSSFRVDALNPGGSTQESSRRVNFSIGARREF